MTIKDLAAQTGYAVATVSRVLNNHPNVSEKARAAIMEAVEESGFQLNANAKQLKQQHATSILVVVKGTANELFSELLETIQSCVAETQYPLFVDYLDEIPMRSAVRYSCAGRRSRWAFCSWAVIPIISRRILEKSIFPAWLSPTAWHDWTIQICPASAWMTGKPAAAHWIP